MYLLYRAEFLYTDYSIWKTGITKINQKRGMSRCEALKWYFVTNSEKKAYV